MSLPASRSITLPFADAITVLMEACRLPIPARQAFEARVRQLQRLGIAPRSPERAHAHVGYGVAELAALATAFKLMEGFMPPGLAARYLSECWGDLAPFLLAGARSILPDEYLMRRNVGHSHIAVFEGGGLNDIGQKERRGERYIGELGRLMIVSELPADISWNDKGACLVLDSKSYMIGLVELTRNCSMATDLELFLELDRLAFA